VGRYRAVDTGYHHIDCVCGYGNQDEVCLLHVPLFIAIKQFGTGWCRSEEGHTYEALQLCTYNDHTAFSWFLNDFDMVGVGSATYHQYVAIVLQSDSGEGTITVDSNIGDRHISPSPLKPQLP
jgi:hypothetical protein